MIIFSLQEWTLAPENGGNIELTFEDFDLEEDKHCSYDYVVVSHGSYSEKFCGHSTPSVITSSGTSIMVTFHTDNSVTRQGFSAEWREV